IALRVVGHLGRHVLEDRHLLRRAHQQRVAVGRALRDGIRADHAPAPTRLSTITGWCKASASFWPTVRATRSVPPPAENGTTILIVLPGYACPEAVCAAAAKTAQSRIRHEGCFIL